MNFADLENIAPFLILLPLVAFMYASVGHGGASGYLALMALFSFPVDIMKPTALLLNIFVAGISFLAFYKGGFFRWKLFYPFALTSVPAAFLGGYLQVEASLYKLILAVLLLFAVAKLLGFFGKESPEERELKPWQGLLIGAIIGLLSGMIGIGGGIILSPIILLMGWGKMKETAAVSALFILVNSVAGIGGYFLHGSTLQPNVFLLVFIAVLGGFLGAYFGSKKLNIMQLRYLLAVVLLMASIKLFWV